MITNQRRAAATAEETSRGALSPNALFDLDGSLLLLAAGTNAVAASAAPVSRRVLHCASDESSYFLLETGGALQPAVRGEATRACAGALAD